MANEEYVELKEEDFDEAEQEEETEEKEKSKKSKFDEVMDGLGSAF